jgi:BioD-like phosphotransacetylase family protein
LNRALCEQHDVKLAGVIINKVRPDKYEQTKDYLSRALKRWNVPLLGCVPDRPYLGHPALMDLERIFKSEMISGSQHRFRHYTVNDISVATTSLTVFLFGLREKPARTLYLCHATREDIVLGFLGEYSRCKRSGIPFEAALIICGQRDKFEITAELKELIDVHQEDVPILLSPFTTHHSMELIHNYTPKLNINDLSRVVAACNHYEQYIDYDLLLKQTGNMLVSKSLGTGSN